MIASRDLKIETEIENTSKVILKEIGSLIVLCESASKTCISAANIAAEGAGSGDRPVSARPH